MARDNRTLGRFHLVGIPPAPRGIPQIEVTFDIDANGIVNVSAKDRGTGKEQKITITASSGLSKDEVDRMMRDAEAHAEEDRKNRESVEQRNRADQAVYAAERMLTDAGDKLSSADKAPVESAIADLKKALEANDVDAIKTGMDALTSAQHKVAEVLYRATAQPSSGEAPGAGSTSSGPAQGEVIDAEVVDEDKK
jgi:molecular chaperone DnaK